MSGQHFALWLARWRYRDEDGISLPPGVFRVLLAGRGLMHGLVTLEVLGRLPPILGDKTEFYEAAMRSFDARLAAGRRLTPGQDARS